MRHLTLEEFISVAQRDASTDLEKELLVRIKETIEECDQDAINTLRGFGNAVVIFTPEELGGANVDRVEDAIIEQSWDIIEVLKP